MKKDLARTIEIPEGIQVLREGNTVIVKGNGKELAKTFDVGKVEIKTTDKTVELQAKKATRRESTMIGTMNAHIKNMIQGIQNEFEYKMEICNVHFPMNVKVEGETVTIKSFLGEKADRKAKIVPGTKVDIKGSNITITSTDIHAAGQTAANIEKASRLKGRDRRIFQDGIFITEKNGRQI